jgi:hypothetical protein
VLLVLAIGCTPTPARQPVTASSPPADAARDAGDARPDDQPTVAVRSATEWTVRVVHALAGQSATGEIVTTTKPTPDNLAPHAGLASAEAWRAIAAALVEHDPAHAYTAAGYGIDALGRSYAPRGTKDDTVFAISSAEQDAAAGSASAAAGTLIRVLGERVDLYYKKYDGAVRRP